MEITADASAFLAAMEQAEQIAASRRKQLIARRLPLGFLVGLNRTVLPIRSGIRVGRNEHCPCGSGAKFKLCCRKRIP